MADAIGALRALPNGMEVFEKEGEPPLYKIPIPDSPLQQERKAATQRDDDTSAAVTVIARPTTPNVQAGGLVPGRRMGRRIVRIKIDTEAYPDFEADVWVNMPDKHITEMQQWTDGMLDPDEAGITADEQAARQAAADDIKQRIANRYHDLVPWTNFVDWDGNPLPPTNDPRFMELVPGDLIQLIMAERQKQVGKLTPLKTAR